MPKSVLTTLLVVCLGANLFTTTTTLSLEKLNWTEPAVQQRNCDFPPEREKPCTTPNRLRRYIPFARPTLFHANTSQECPPASSSEDFPAFFTPQQRENGAVLLCLVIGVYCFTLLAIVCDNYFLPCVERICDALNLSQDVAAATFMSIATSCPELFTNIIGTFVTESDMGIGTIVGSSLFNALGVASLGGLAAAKPIKLDWWPVTRDVIIYIIAVSILVVITWDNRVYWFEGLTLFVVSFIYFIIMFQNVRISKFVRKFTRKYRVSPTEAQEEKKNSSTKVQVAIIAEASPQKPNSSSHYYGSYMDQPTKTQEKTHKEFVPECTDDESLKSIFEVPKGKLWKKVFFFYTWPIKLVLWCTIPDPKKHRRLFPLTFVMCILWIGSNSYLISWMISIIGAVFRIPDAVLGLTFLAAGGCLPESISITIMSRRGEGSMGVSNSLGANTMNILLSLGMPWFFKTIFKGTNRNSYIEIQSGSIEYTILALVLVALTLYAILYFNKFHLSKLAGVIFLIVYLVCVILAILSEMVFFKKRNKCAIHS